MIHHITADRLVESATQAVTEELFHDFDNTLRTLCDEDDDRKPFSAPCVMRVFACTYYADISRKRKRRGVIPKFSSCISS